MTILDCGSVPGPSLCSRPPPVPLGPSLDVPTQVGRSWVHFVRPVRRGRSLWQSGRSVEIRPQECVVVWCTS